MESQKNDDKSSVPVLNDHQYRELFEVLVYVSNEMLVSKGFQVKSSKCSFGTFGQPYYRLDIEYEPETNKSTDVAPLRPEQITKVGRFGRLRKLFRRGKS